MRDRDTEVRGEKCSERGMMMGERGGGGGLQGQHEAEEWKEMISGEDVD